MTLPSSEIQCTNPECQKIHNIQNITSNNLTEAKAGRGICSFTCDNCGQEIINCEDFPNDDQYAHLYDGSCLDDDQYDEHGNPLISVSTETQMISDTILSDEKYPDGDRYDHLGNKLHHFPANTLIADGDCLDDDQYDDHCNLLHPVSNNPQMVNNTWTDDSINADHTNILKIQHTNNLHEKNSETDCYTLFIKAISNIDKNLTRFEQINKISDSLCLLSIASSPIIQLCMRELKETFDLTMRDIEGFRKELTKIQKEYIAKQKRTELDKLIDQCTIKPKILTYEEKMKAFAYLQDPNLVKNISRDIAYAGNLIGEEINKMMLYFASISRKFDQPISLVIFGKSSSGKSYLANTVEKFVPPEDSLSISSSSGRGFEYLGSQLQHKCILIQEWEGAENILPTIRTIQSEGKLNRLVSVEDPDSPNQRKSVAMSFKCPCSVVITTTQENIHDENSTRIFELYADESVSQTENIVKASFENANLNQNGDKREKDRIVELHRDAQRCLDKVDVNIPFGHLINFPMKTTRHRRDANRFLQLIKVVAFLHQKQKNIFEKDGLPYIEADLKDYDIAYNYGISILKNTLNKISQRSKDVLLVCCAIADEKGKAVSFTTKDIQEKAGQLGLDFNSRPDLYKQLIYLTEYEYLEFEQAKTKGQKFYKVCFDYVRNENGIIINIDSPDIKEITTPWQLRQNIITS